MSNKHTDKLATATKKAEAKVAAISVEIAAKEAEIKILRTELVAAKTAVEKAEQEHTFAVLAAEKISVADLKAFIASRRQGGTTEERANG